MDTIICDYASQQSAIRQVRDIVFVVEQNVDKSEEFDDRDALCTHAVTWDANEPIATGRIDVAKDGKIGRVAVIKEYRRRGVGTAIMKALEEVARKDGLAEAWFHAQTQAVPFYEQLGYTTCGEQFMEANIPHIKMKKALA